MYLRKVHLQKFYVRNISDYGLRKHYYYKKKKVSSSLVCVCPFMVLICCKITYLWYKTVTICVYIKESININY